MTWENLWKEFKLSYMQMQEWIRTMVLMAIARILSPKRDSPYLGFCCRRRMELQTKTLFSAIPSWSRVSFWSVSPPIPQILCEGFVILSSCSYALWFPYRLSVVPRARQGYRLWVLMASPALSRISSGWVFWPGNIVRPSVGKGTSLSTHWYWVGFLRLQHQCVRLWYSRTAFPKWGASWRRLPCWGWWNQRE